MRSLIESMILTLVIATSANALSLTQASANRCELRIVLEREDIA